MSPRSTLPAIVTVLDSDETVHLARLMLLLHAFERSNQPALEGITKLAKLDFLLRYPTYFERAMLACRVNPKKLDIEQYERDTVESQMVRYRYGPWDHRYRRFLNILAAKRMISLETDGRAILISLTAQGKEYAERLLANDANRSLFGRARVLRQHLDISPTRIMKFIYDTFPEIATLAYNEAIPK